MHFSQWSSWIIHPISLSLRSLCANSVKMSIVSVWGGASVKRCIRHSDPASCPLCLPWHSSDRSCKHLCLGISPLSLSLCPGASLPPACGMPAVTCRAYEQTRMYERMNAPRENWWLPGPTGGTWAPGLSPGGAPEGTIDMISAQKYPFGLSLAI